MAPSPSRKCSASAPSAPTLPDDEDVFERIRSGCRHVADRAAHVRIDVNRLDAYVDEYETEPLGQRVEPMHEPLGDDEATAAFVVTHDAVNFGSGWHPVLRKRPGCSGSMTILATLRERAERDGPLSAVELAGLTPAACADLLSQDPNGPAGDLMALFARSLNDLGCVVRDEHGGSFAALVESAGGSAARLVHVLQRMPTYTDTWGYDGIEVPLLKRAQITVHDLALAFGGQRLGAFADIDRLTIFADNLVPHVLRLDGVLTYDDHLVRRIEAGVLLDAGSREEVEIRSVAVHAVELLAARVRDTGGTRTPRDIDEILWRRGGAPEYKAVPRHRCRTTAY